MVGIRGFIFHHLMSIFPAIAVFRLYGMFYSVEPKPSLSILKVKSCKIESKSQKSLLKFVI